MRIDIPTVLLIEALCSFMAAVVLASSLRRTPGPGTREATASMACLVPALVLYMLRGRIPDAIAAVGANLLIWATAALIHRAVWRFTTDRPPPAWPGQLLVFAAPTFALLAFAEDLYGVRVLFTSMMVATLLLAAIAALVRDGGLAREPARRFMLALLALSALGLLVRIGIVLPSWHLPAQPLAPTLETSLAFVPSILLAQGFGPAFLLMQRERSEEHARRLATTDVLTGCLNRRALEERARVELAYARRKQAPLALVIVDLDHFKRINDTRGHAVGDAVIARVGSLLRTCVRPGDLVARYGGEEFCVLLRDVTPDVALATAERLCSQVRVAKVEADGGLVPISASLGVASATLAADESWEALFKRTDAALYRAKGDGRDRVVAA